MPRKVFCSGKNTIALKPASIGQALSANQFGIVAKASHADYRVFRIAVHIHHGGKIHVNSHPFALFGNLAPHFVDQIIVLNSAQCHLIRIGNGLSEAHGQAPFGINGNEKGRSGVLLPFVGLIQLRFWRAFKKANSANIVLLNESGNVVAIGFVGLVGPNNHELSNALFNTKRLIYRVSPSHCSFVLSLQPNASKNKKCQKGEFDCGRTK